MSGWIGTAIPVGEAGGTGVFHVHPIVYAGVFLVALVLALVLTPLSGMAARRFRILDMPSRRKLHRRPIPRGGGIALYLSFILPFCAYLLYVSAHRDSAVNVRSAGFLLGATAAFTLGMIDDLKNLSPWLKLLGQFAIGVLAFASGFAINVVDLPGFGNLELGVFALPVTVLWFLLILNAVNLIDGLDGLAAGVTFFSSTVLFVLCLLNDQLLAAVGFATVAGATLGFLRYNFNPASIFMGDSGSHLLGFTLASLSIVGSMKSSASVAILIPILAMGLPLMDVIWSAVRRFFLGRNVFRADSDHLHHRLLKIGYTHRRAVLVLYGVTAMLGCVSLFLVHCTNRQAALILLIVGACAIISIRRLGYIDYLTSEKTLGWLRDITSAIGVERGSRTFLGIQMAITDSASLEDLWENVLLAAEHLQLDKIRLEVQLPDAERPKIFEKRNGAWTTACTNPAATVFAALEGSSPQARMMRIQLPLGRVEALGSLLLEQDFERIRPDYYLLRRIERLRRATEETLEKFCASSQSPGHIITMRPYHLAPSYREPAQTPESAAVIPSRRDTETVLKV